MSIPGPVSPPVTSPLAGRPGHYHALGLAAFLRGAASLLKSAPSGVEWSAARGTPGVSGSWKTSRETYSYRPSGVPMPMVKPDKTPEPITAFLQREVPRRGIGGPGLARGACEKFRFPGPTPAVDLGSLRLEPRIRVSASSPHPHESGATTLLVQRLVVRASAFHACSGP